MPAGGARHQRVQEGGHGTQGVEPRAGRGASARLREGVPADAKLGGFNGFRGVLCATRMLTSFLLTLLSWGVLHYRADPSAAAGDCAAYFGTVFASALARAQQRAAAEAGGLRGRRRRGDDARVPARARPWRRPRSAEATWRRPPRRWA